MVFLEWILHFGAPAMIQTDHGAEFYSKLMQSLCQMLDIQKQHMLPYHWQANGMVEIINQVILEPRETRR